MGSTWHNNSSTDGRQDDFSKLFLSILGDDCEQNKQKSLLSHIITTLS